MNSESRHIKKMYADKPSNFYAQQMNAHTMRAIWFRQRQDTTKKLVKKYYTGGIVLDIGCGNCLWNDGSIPTVGIDICESMLRYNREHIPLFSALKADVNGKIPLKNNSIELVVMTEFLEHFIDYAFLINELQRVLKKDGVVVCSVPHGKLPGLWGLIFPVWCWLKGRKDKDEYYLNRCGHMVNFNMHTVRRAFTNFTFLEGFSLELLTIFFVAKKR